MTAELAIDSLGIRVAGRTLVENLSLELAGGMLVCVLGTNGVGKTLTLHTLAGLRPPDTGQIRVCGDPLPALSRRALARRLGLLLQIHEDSFPQTVLDHALMGRYPHLDVWEWTRADDRQLALDALQTFDLAGFEDHSVFTLSGGERERLALATLQVQDPAIWLLDEPLNHLDPHHQLAVMHTLQSRARAGRLVMATLHNPAHAMRFADRVLLLYGNGHWEFGPTSDLMEPQRMERLYHTPFSWFRADGDAGRALLLPG